MPAIKPSLPRFVVRSAKHSFILTDMSEEKENENEGIVIDDGEIIVNANNRNRGCCEWR